MDTSVYGMCKTTLFACGMCKREKNDERNTTYKSTTHVTCAFNMRHITTASHHNTENLMKGFNLIKTTLFLIPSPFLSASVEQVRPVYPALICDIKEIPE